MAQALPRSSEGFIWTPKGGYSRGLRTPAVVSSTPENELRSKYDVIVIGAGFAGLSAARDLALAGKDVLLIEGRDRIGGRAWTSYDDGGAKFEMGGAWVHWSQPHVFTELQQYGLDEFDITIPHAKNGEVFVKRHRNEPVQIETGEEQEAAMADMTNAMVELLDIDGQGGRSVIAFPFNTASSIATNPMYMMADKLSIAERARQIERLSAEQKESLIEHASSFFGSSGEDASFLELLHMNSLCYFSDALVEEATMKYKISQGTTALALAILSDFQGHRMFSSPVSAIGQQSNGCKVTLSSGKEFFGSKVISTIPANVSLSIRYEPSLSTIRHQGLAEGSCPARIDKVLVTTSKDLQDGMSVSCEGGDMPYLSGFGDGVQRKDQSLITMLSKPDIDLDSCEDGLKLLEMCHPAGLDITTVRAHLWSNDPFAGGVMANRKPGFVFKYWEELRKPHGDLYFCGSDWAEGWRGFISGAFEDSYRVTREILCCGDDVSAK